MTQPLRDVYRTCLMMNKTDKVNKDGNQVRIDYQVDLVVALNNTPTSPDYDAEIPMIAGTKLFVEYATPDNKSNHAYFTFKEQAERFIEALEDPNSYIYTEAA